LLDERPTTRYRRHTPAGDFAAEQPSAIVVTHDRAFLDPLRDAHLELDRGTLRSYPATFSDYERVKAGELAAEAVARASSTGSGRRKKPGSAKGVEARRTPTKAGSSASIACAGSAPRAVRASAT